MTRPRCLDLLLACALVAHTARAAEWEPLPPMPAPNGGFLAGVSQGKIYVLGGTNWSGGVKNWLQDIHSFDPATKKWETCGALDSPLAYGLAGTTDEGEIVFGAGHTGKEPWAGIGVLSGGKVLPAEARHHHAVTAVAAGGVWGGRLFIVGGTSDVADLSLLRRTAVAIRVRTGELEPLADFPGKAFGTAGSVIVNGRLFIFGGAHWDAASQAVVNSQEAHALDLREHTWRRLARLPVAVRGLSAVAVDDSHIYLAGGYRSAPDGFIADAWVYDIAADAFSPARPLPAPGMCGLVRCGDFLYCMGGEDKMKSRSDKCHRIPVAELRAAGGR